jgi:tetratricopeptide repeat protein 21B
VAWHIESSMAMGYRLVPNLLRAKRRADVINVCHKVLAKHPAYPQIWNDVLQQAREALR